MHILCLTGPTSCGKTTTLNILHDLLVARGCKSTNKKQVGSDPFDFEAIVVMPGGKKVGIYTVGDLSQQLMDAIRRYDTLLCDTFVCACNDKFVKPPRFIRTYPHNFVLKVREANKTMQASANSACAAHLNTLI